MKKCDRCYNWQKLDTPHSLIKAPHGTIPIHDFYHHFSEVLSWEGKCRCLAARVGIKYTTRFKSRLQPNKRLCLQYKLHALRKSAQKMFRRIKKRAETPMFKLDDLKTNSVALCMSKFYSTKLYD